MKQSLLEKIDLVKNADNLDVDIRAVLEHMTKEKKEK